jgi:bacteriorhodopsin
MNDPIVDITTKISIYVQAAVGIVDIVALTVNVPEQHLLLKDILALETIVQVIETGWYVFVIQYLPQEEMAKNRYYDWLLSTPLMLVSLFCYLLYENQLENNTDGTPLRLSEIVKQYSESITRIILSNLAMLSIGYLYETGQISKQVAFWYGLIFLVNTFSIIYSDTGTKSTKSNIIFIIMFLLWSIYGMAFLLPTAKKNAIFNIIDLFSKNFFELYIAILAFQKRI